MTDNVKDNPSTRATNKSHLAVDVESTY